MHDERVRGRAGVHLVHGEHHDGREKRGGQRGGGVQCRDHVGEGVRVQLPAAAGVLRWVGGELRGVDGRETGEGGGEVGGGAGGVGGGDVGEEVRAIVRAEDVGGVERGEGGVEEGGEEVRLLELHLHLQLHLVEVGLGLGGSSGGGGGGAGIL